MKHTFIALSFVMLIGFGSCKKFFDQVPNDQITIDQVFQKKAASQNFLANVYSYVDDESKQWTDFPWTGNSDELDVTWSKYATYDLARLNMSAGNVLFNKWGEYYRGIRAATYFINHIDGNQEILALNGQQLIDQYKAEARFLRAYYYFLLMRQFGPVVIIGENELPVDATAADLQLPRLPFDECVDYVVKELDMAASVLPLVPEVNGTPSASEAGRATKGMALAVKARLLLYAASPLYNGNKEYANFKNPDGTPLINQTYDESKWKKASDAAKAVIDLNQYSLFKDPGGDPVTTASNILLSPWNNEAIFVRKSNSLTDWDKNAFPRQGDGWCGLGPTQEMVDAYFMSDGKPISESPLYSESGFTDVNGVSVYNMYRNREPRFYASITYNNSLWMSGQMTAPKPISFFVDGPNGKNGHPTDWTKTGYLIRKNVSWNQTARPLVLFRLGEIYLNYAEALNEYDPSNPDILKYLNLIRERAGIPQYGTGSNALPVPADQNEMRKKIWAERRVELAFEYHRWFDIRRWKIAGQVMGDLHGMDVNKTGNDFYHRVVATSHLFKNAFYWFPIEQYELDRARMIVQNPGW
ncbi:hypothetical protein A8C56_06085 [Niabella ginsenosidivorans]|uniref:RagB/SusD family nutrient uptake outer membrane protein n=2 Tax=Niabella ginsenosidivorans TaxID=1176587 RepID=A0A1A9HYX5_9BACT|nr:hypothetical protein A8C56_06085 [Niabella ginsenosidivorans]